MLTDSARDPDARRGHAAVQGALFDAAATGGVDTAAGAMAVRLDLPDADIVYLPTHFSAADADRLQAVLTDTVSWHDVWIRIHGRHIPVPRRTAWYGDTDRVYTYSGIELQPASWTDPLLEIKRSVEAVAGWTSNSVLLNLYRDGRDSVAWHADDEPELGREPVIASVSLGATRRFHLRHNDEPEHRTQLDLAHGSVLIMRGPTQHYWRHQLSKTARPVGPRINLTFRFVSPSAPRRAPCAPASLVPRSRAAPLAARDVSDR